MHTFIHLCISVFSHFPIYFYFVICIPIEQVQHCQPKLIQKYINKEIHIRLI